MSQSTSSSASTYGFGALPYDQDELTEAYAAAVSPERLDHLQSYTSQLTSRKTSVRFGENAKTASITTRLDNPIITLPAFTPIFLEGFDPSTLLYRIQKGQLLHEILHEWYTPLDYYQATVNEYNQQYQDIAGEVFNSLSDTAIETTYRSQPSNGAADDLTFVHENRIRRIWAQNTFKDYSFYGAVTQYILDTGRYNTGISKTLLDETDNTIVFESAEQRAAFDKFYPRLCKAVADAQTISDPIDRVDSYDEFTADLIQFIEDEGLDADSQDAVDEQQTQRPSSENPSADPQDSDAKDAEAGDSGTSQSNQEVATPDSYDPSENIDDEPESGDADQGDEEQAQSEDSDGSGSGESGDEQAEESPGSGSTSDSPSEGDEEQDPDSTGGNGESRDEETDEEASGQEEQQATLDDWDELTKDSEDSDQEDSDSEAGPTDGDESDSTGPSNPEAESPNDTDTDPSNPEAGQSEDGGGDTSEDDEQDLPEPTNDSTGSVDDGGRDADSLDESPDDRLPDDNEQAKSHVEAEANRREMREQEAEAEDEQLREALQAGDSDLGDIVLEDSSHSGFEAALWEKAETLSPIVAAELEARLKEEQRDTTRRGLPTGKVDPRTLAHDDMDPNTMMRTSKGEQKDYSFVLILDRSSSRADAIDDAVVAVCATLLALEQLGIDTAVIDFYKKNPRLIKRFSDDPQVVRHKLATTETGGGTPLGKVMEVAHEHLKQASNTCGHIVMTDGLPGDGDVFESTVEQCRDCRQMLLGFMLEEPPERRREQVEEHMQKYDSASIVEDIDDLPFAVDRTLSQIVT